MRCTGRRPGRGRRGRAGRADPARGGKADPRGPGRGRAARPAILRYQAQAALDPDGDTYPSADGRSLLMSRRRPRGVVGLITPWNFPIAIPAWKLAPALAYGNVCVWKPSPFCARLRRGAARVPRARAARRRRCSSCRAAATPAPRSSATRGVAAVSFTGSVATGAAVARMAVERGAAVQCEMGGQNASIVLADADLESAAATIASAAMGYAGQKCTATSRVICDGAPCSRRCARRSRRRWPACGSRIPPTRPAGSGR